MNESQHQSSIPLFTPVTAPRITSIAHADLVQWKKERLEYEEKVRTRCMGDETQNKDIILSVKDSFNSDILTLMCELSWDINVEEITDNIIWTKINEIIGSVKNQTLPNITQLFKEELQMNLNQDDVNARVLDYFLQCKKLIEKHGLSSCFEGVKGEKHKNKLLVASLSPATLKCAAEDELTFKDRDNDIIKSQSLLYKLVLDKALEQEKSFQINRKKVKLYNTDVRPSKRKFENKQKDTSEENLPSIKRFKKPEKPPYGCLKCKKDHWLDECTLASPEEKKKLIMDFRANKKQQWKDKQKPIKFKRLKHIHENDNNERLMVTLNGTYQMPYCADTGSEYNIISRKHVEMIQKLIGGCIPSDLDEPIHGSAVGGYTIKANQYINLKIQLYTTAGLVSIEKPKRCVIIEEDENEFLIGRPLLKELGIDVDRMLEQLAVPSNETIDPIILNDTSIIEHAREKDINFN